jgi:biotin operon repressor
MFGAIKQIKQDIEEIKNKQERIIWIMNEVMKYGKKVNSHNQSVVITRTKHDYYKRLIPVLSDRFKRIDHIARSLKVTEKTAITYIKLARKAGYNIETRSARGQRPSYKLNKETF